MPVIPGPTPLPPGAWISPDDLPCDIEDADLALVNQVIVMASQGLNDMVGGRYPGPTTDLLWPSVEACGCAAWRAWSRATPGARRGIVGDARRCGTPTDRVALSIPVREILEVRLDGEVVDPALYRVLDNRWLVALDDLRWPQCQRHDESTLEGTFSVEYVFGPDPPVGGKLAAGSLTCELLRMFEIITSDEPCRLRKVTSVGRQGVNQAVRSFDPSSLFADGATGLEEVDFWLLSVNGAPARAGGSFMDPARRRPGHRR